MVASMLSVLSVKFIVLVGFGSVLGLLVGALPGLSAITGVALLVSMSFSWPATDALAMIMGIYVLACFAGAVTAILMNIPGAPAAVATVLDGYPLGKKGEAKTAILTAVLASTFGSLVSILALVLLARPMSRIALLFSPMDYFLLSIFGLTTVGSIASKSFVKGMICAFFGVFLSTIGIDPFVGTPRFTFGFESLLVGIPTIPVIIGLFGFSELFAQIGETAAEAEILEYKNSVFRIGKILGHWALAVRSSLIGLVVGILPGAGAPIAALLSYDNAKKTVKHPEVPFGEGAVEGIIASEAANNAVIGGALVPMLSLGIPGDSVTTIILSVFYIHGLRPGPLMFTETPELFSTIVLGGVVGCLFLLVLGFSASPLLVRVVRIPKQRLFPVIFVLCAIGAYATNSSLYDVALMIVFGLVGYYMKRRDFSPAAMVLGLVLGQLMDINFRRAVSLAANTEHMVWSMIGNPISLTMIALIALSLLFSAPGVKRLLTGLFKLSKS